MSDKMVPLRKQSGYAKAYDFLLDSNMTGEELRIYLMLMRYGDSSSNRIPLQATLAKRRGVKKQAISNMIGSLVNKGWITVERIKVPEDKRSSVYATKRNKYTLMVPPQCQEAVSVIDEEGVSIVDEHEPPKPTLDIHTPLPNDLEDYVLKGGMMAGHNISVLKENQTSLEWYRDECIADREAVQAWLANQRLPTTELDAIARVLISPHRDVEIGLRTTRTLQDLQSYARRKDLSKRDVQYIQEKLKSG